MTNELNCTNCGEYAGSDIADEMERLKNALGAIQTEGNSVWVLSVYAMDAEGEEWQQLDTLYQNKPTKEILEKKLKYHAVRSGFVETLLEKGEAYGGGYDNWHFELEEINCV